MTRTNAKEPPPAAMLCLLPLPNLRPHPKNPRGPITDADVADLVASIRAQGLLQPLVVRPVTDDGRSIPLGQVAGTYELLAGHRRLAALRAIAAADGDSTPRVPCLVREADAAQALQLVLSDNAHHRDADPFLEGAAVEAALEENGGDVKELARALGLSVRWVAARRSMRNLSPAWAERVRHQEPWRSWPTFVVEELVTLAPDAQDAFFKAHAKELGGPGGPPPRSWWTERLASWTHQLARAPWDLADTKLVKAAGACLSCPYTSASQPGLFDDGAPTDPAAAVCLQGSCWDRKVTAHNAARLAAARQRAWDDSSVASPFLAAAVVLPKDAALPVPKGFGYVLKPTEYELAKGRGDGARPALSVHGDLESVVWIRPTKEAATRLDGTRTKPKAAKEEAAKAAPAAPPSPAEVLAELEAQHRARVEGAAVVRFLKELDRVKPPRDLTMLVSVFGVLHVDPVADLPRRRMPKDQRAALARVWAGIRKAVDSSLSHGPEGWWRTAAPWAAGEAGIPWDRLVKLAEDDVTLAKELRAARQAVADQAAAERTAAARAKRKPKAKPPKRTKLEEAKRRRVRAELAQPAPGRAAGKGRGARPRTPEQARAHASLQERQEARAKARKAADPKGVVDAMERGDAVLLPKRKAAPAERKPRRGKGADAPLVPMGRLTPGVVSDALLLAACPDGKARDGGGGKRLEGWTKAQLAAAYDWAMREHLGASDHPDVKRRPCPEHVLALPPCEDGPAEVAPPPSA